MLDTLKSLKGNRIFNQSLGGEIEIRTSSIKKYKSFFADKNKRLIVPYIPELLAKARFISENTYTPLTERNIVAYWKADLPINIDSDTYNVHLTVKQDNNGNFFWDAQVQEKAPQTVPATNPGVEGLKAEQSAYKNSISLEKKEVNKSFYQLPVKAYKDGKADINTPEFKRWFGDSKVVDKNGRPLVVYHGTNADFDTFKGTKILNSSEGVGFNFAVKKNIAEAFGKVMPVYLKLENPVYAYGNIDLVSDTYENDFEIENQEAIQNAIYKVKENLEQKGYTFYNEVYADMLDDLAEHSQAQKVLDGLLDLGGYIQEDYDAETLYNDIRQAEIDAFGIDGYVTNNYGAAGGKIYIAFKSNQIKSVYNRGTFSTKSNNIYRQTGNAEIDNSQKGEKIKGSFDRLTKSIKITKEADFSTYQHEFAHFWLDNIWDYANSGKASEEYIKQFNELKKWLGVKPYQNYFTRAQLIWKESRVKREKFGIKRI